MKPIKHIVLTIFLTIGIFSAVIYTSCQKDDCKGITCLNGGTCGGGICNCAYPGIGGTNCQTIYRNLYANAYVGIVKASSQLDTVHVIVDSTCINNSLVFSQGTDTTNYNNMDVIWTDNNNNQVLNMKITLSNNSATGSDFTLDTVTSDTFSYAGTGTVSTVSASLNLVRSHPHGPSTVTFVFSNFTEQ